ncbi:MAG: hypothetical protein WBM78_10400 [Desulfobacterales bacterium]
MPSTPCIISSFEGSNAKRYLKNGPGGFYREALDGIRLASDERILGSSEFVEATLKNAGEFYERRMRMQPVGIDLSAVTAAASCYLGIEE